MSKEISLELIEVEGGYQYDLYVRNWNLVDEHIYLSEKEALKMACERIIQAIEKELK